MSTFFYEDIEFVLPGIYKAYPLAWADNFLSGRIYFTTLNSFRKDDDPQRGDQLEGTGITIRQGVRCTAGYITPIFVWCSTMETDLTVITETWKDRDTVLQITDTLALIRRVRDAVARLKLKRLRLAVGPVTYDKDEGSYREYHWVEGIFQKNLRYSGQKEFRLALVGDIRMKDEENVILELGNCTDIAQKLE